MADRACSLLCLADHFFLVKVFRWEDKVDNKIIHWLTWFEFVKLSLWKIDLEILFVLRSELLDFISYNLLLFPKLVSNQVLELFPQVNFRGCWQISVSISRTHNWFFIFIIGVLNEFTAIPLHQLHLLLLFPNTTETLKVIFRRVWMIHVIFFI